jgi:hypothetical protein
VAVPILGKVLRFVFIPPRWEVVQLVGLQTLDLAILVRVQASQPKFDIPHRFTSVPDVIRKRLLHQAYWATDHTQCWYRIWYILERTMGRARKITVEVPVELLERAQQATDAGVTQTVRTGLQLVAASQTYARLRTAEELKADR